jgi:hypothetical protein
MVPLSPSTDASEVLLVGPAPPPLLPLPMTLGVQLSWFFMVNRVLSMVGGSHT